MRINNDQLKFTRFWQADQTSADNAANLPCAAAFQTVGSQLLGTSQQYPCSGLCRLSGLSWRKSSRQCSEASEANPPMRARHGNTPSTFHCSACLLTVWSALLCWVDHSFTKLTKTKGIWIGSTQWQYCLFYTMFFSHLFVLKLCLQQSETIVQNSC